MRFSEAFEALGYQVAVPRQDWSAEKSDGVCISLWMKEINWKGLSIDTKIDTNPSELWRHKPGNKKRVRHLARALAEFDGWIDVVSVHGEPGHGFGDASPWIANQRRGRRWRVLEVDEVTGDFRAAAIEP